MPMIAISPVILMCATLARRLWPIRGSGNTRLTSRELNM